MPSTFARSQSTSSARGLQPFFEQAGLHASPEKLHAVTPLIRERIKLLRDAVAGGEFLFRRRTRAVRPGGVDSAEGRCGAGAARA